MLGMVENIEIRFGACGQRSHLENDLGRKHPPSWLQIPGSEGPEAYFLDFVL